MILPWFEHIYKDLLLNLKQTSLHHGNLFVGVKGLGKRSFLEQVAKAILCHSESNPCGLCKSCLLFEAQTHPDFINVGEEGIGIDDVRGAISRLTSTAQLGGNKVLVLSYIEQMSVSAANALLKTLEEPTRNTFILMSCESTHKLLPTILSRSNKLVCQTPNVDALRDWIKPQLPADIEDKSVEEAIRVCGQSPFQTLDYFMSEDSIKFDTFKLTFKDFIRDQVSLNQLVEQWMSLEARVFDWLSVLITDQSNHAWTKQLSLEKYRGLQALVKEIKSRYQSTGVNRKLQLQSMAIAARNHYRESVR